jgi:serine/threonine protein kinase
VRALVMELVEGSTLAARIAVGAGSPRRLPVPGYPRGAALPLDETLHIAKQIADGLEFAHEHGIIHRDLKPANVKVTPDGTVKVLDFGLAKALAPDMSATNLANSPTISIAPTQAGVILGTAAYMSPEQAKGKSVDRRTDIWAFGCVLYEMLADKKAFEGESVSDVLAAVIMRQPDWTALPESTSTSIRRLLGRCLEKDSKRRLQAIGEARIAIEESLSGTESAAAVSDRRLGTGAHRAPLQPRHRVIIWSLALLAALCIGALLSSLMRAPQPPTRPIARLVVTLPPTDRLALGLTPTIALSPDGSRLVYVANHSGRAQLYVRTIDSIRGHGDSRH